MKKYKNYLIILLFIIILFSFYIRNNQNKEYSKRLFYMDTYISVKVYINNEKKAKEALDDVEQIYRKYHKLSDRFNEYENNVYTINKLKNNQKMEIDPKLVELLNYSISWYEKSGQRLNINLGNVIDVWKKYREFKNGVPTIEELKKANNSNINNINLENNIISGTNINIDLGAISKGYATEEAGKYLKNKGIDKFLINAGGNVLVGKYYKQGKYKIGIESPNRSDGLYQKIKAENVAVSTSGGYERNYEYEGVLYHHIIDPKTLFPSTYMKSVTVITPSAKDSDAFSTTLFLMPIEDGLEFIKNYPEVEAIWYSNDNQIIKSKGFSKYE